MVSTISLFGWITAVCIAGAAAYLGTLMLSRRMALVAGPLGHLTLPGIALALIYGFDITLGAFPFVVLGIILIWLFEIRTKLPMEALTAVSVAALTIYDMCKSYDREMTISDIRLLEKSGGKSGTFKRKTETPDET